MDDGFQPTGDHDHSSGTVALTHVYPATDELDLVAEVRRGYDGEVIVAEDGLDLDL